ncbi:GatB/YqeY domain-containing protein [Ferrimonas pelagia]|uniref:GatB/YqeY domain-containing protein n=1 Tax=Ferrimonas pelagia TaxID=1177826 RepID=A0ABP9FEH3_9GAMM
MTLIEQLKDAMKMAMRAKEKARLGTIRLALAAIKQVEVDEAKTLSDDEITVVLTKMVKQRRDSIKQYEDAGRPELAEAEAAEVVVLQEFLPQQLSAEEMEAAVADVIAESGASSMRDMGKVMGLLQGKLQGRADMAEVGKIVKAQLG